MYLVSKEGAGLDGDLDGGVGLRVVLNLRSALVSPRDGWVMRMLCA